METTEERDGLLAKVGITLKETPDSSLPFPKWVEAVVFQLVTAEQQALLQAFAVELLPRHKRLLEAYVPTTPVITDRLYFTTLHTQVRNNSLFRVAKILARRKAATICFAVFDILRAFPGTLEPTEWLDLFLMVYVGHKAAVEYAGKILIKLADKQYALPFIRVFRGCLRPFDVIFQHGICDLPVVCKACVVSPGVCRMYEFLQELTAEEKMRIAVNFGLPTIALSALQGAHPNSVILTACKLVIEAKRCSFYIGPPLAAFLDGLQTAGFVINEHALVENMFTGRFLNEADPDTVIDTLRLLCRRPSWKQREAVFIAGRILRTHSQTSRTYVTLTQYILPFLASMSSVASGDTVSKSRHAKVAEMKLKQIDGEHTLARTLQNTTPLCGPALCAVMQLLDHIATPD